MFHIFSILVKLNVTVRMGSHTLGLQSDLQIFDAIHKEEEGKFFPNLCTCANLSRRRGKLVYGKSTRQNQDARF